MSTPSPEPPISGYAPLNPFSVGVASLAVLLWGGTAVANAFAIDQLPPVLVGAIRFGMASVFMLFWCRVEGASLWLPRRRDWRNALILGLLLFLQISTFNIGLAASTASHATLFVNSFIFWVAIYEQFIARSIRLQWWQSGGLLLAAAGSALLLLDNKASPTSVDRVTLFGDCVLALSGFFLGIKIVYTKHAVKDASPGALILWHDIIGTVMFLACSLAFETMPKVTLTMPTILALVYAGLLVSGFCFAANAWLLQQHGASQVSVFSFATPVCGVTLGVLFRGDQLSLWLALAGACVAVGIYLVNMPARQPVAGTGELVD